MKHTFHISLIQCWVSSQSCGLKSSMLSCFFLDQDVKEGGIEDGVPRIRFKEGQSPGKAEPDLISGISIKLERISMDIGEKFFLDIIRFRCLLTNDVWWSPLGEWWNQLLQLVWAITEATNGGSGWQWLPQLWWILPFCDRGGLELWAFVAFVDVFEDLCVDDFNWYWTTFTWTSCITMLANTDFSHDCNKQPLSTVIQWCIWNDVSVGILCVENLQKGSCSQWAHTETSLMGHGSAILARTDLRFPPSRASRIWDEPWIPWNLTGDLPNHDTFQSNHV